MIQIVRHQQENDIDLCPVIIIRSMINAVQGKTASLMQIVSCIFIAMTEWTTESDRQICLGAKQAAAQESPILLIRSLAPTATIKILAL